MTPAESRSTASRPGTLGRLPERGREAVLAAATTRSWERGALLTRDGEDALALLVLEAGHVLVRLTTEAGDQVALAVQGAGDVLGEVGLTSARRERTADAVALDAVTALALRRADFDRIRRQNPEVDDFVMEIMARRIDRLSHRLAEAFHVPVETRVARRLYEVGRLWADEPVVRIPLTQEDVAGLAGTTRPTANAALRALERAGIVQLHRGRVDLLDLPALRARCR